MTIEEFRNFGWKAGMRVKGEDGDEYEIIGVDLRNRRVECDGIVYPFTTTVEDCDSILNPDGTVAWRKE